MSDWTFSKGQKLITSDEASFVRGDDPILFTWGPNHVTMRHWTTSFLLLKNNKHNMRVWINYFKSKITCYNGWVQLLPIQSYNRYTIYCQLLGNCEQIISQLVFILLTYCVMTFSDFASVFVKKWGTSSNRLIIVSLFWIKIMPS